MPIYEYRCQACGHEIEVLQKITDEPLSQCPSCNTYQLSKLISAAGFRLKGGGWYETDFKSNKNKRNLVSSSDAPKEGSNNTESGKDSAGPATTQSKESSTLTTSTNK
ncbi:FmdB family zinc ribbon protein [Candidatus Nitrosacidococcus tergens]|uniref:Putative regulatory protein, FmdB family n=1 Tax=Candidatus Nitrosacidococcus tergens TaxID=553981 RepID=A0A7G1Q7U4_9GAMM|nr:zinc ribbon domain-containing protein [Candidatus Nitrosacidococcus tergens]CAB1274285.1 putative regulatory protein, FmdB family [Candidatus Nitrosacidococcus tergens]